MSRRPIPFFAVLIALVAMSLPALARSNSNATIKASFDISSTTKISSTTLAPGTYNVVVEGDHAKFVKDGKTVAEVPCTLKDLPSKAQETEFQINDHNYLTEIQVSGKTQAIEFATS